MISELKARDYDKFLAVNFAPEHLKEALAAVFTYHLDVADIPVEVSEAMIGHVKIQWWREVLQEIIDGKPPRPHPVLLAMKGFDIGYIKLLGILEYYDSVLENKLPESFEELKSFLLNTEVKILEVAAQLVKAPFNESLALAYAYNRMARAQIRQFELNLRNRLY
jgi:phytoene synthase